MSSNKGTLLATAVFAFFCGVVIGNITAGPKGETRLKTGPCLDEWHGNDDSVVCPHPQHHMVVKGVQSVLCKCEASKAEVGY